MEFNTFYDKKIEKTEARYLDGEKFIRVFFENNNYFVDVPADTYENWKELSGNYE